MKPFVEYKNIVPNTDTTYYLWLYYVFTEHPMFIKYEPQFSSTKEDIYKLLGKYTLNNIIVYHKNNFHNTDVTKIFTEECLKVLKENNIML